MKLYGLQKMTLLDFPGHVACTVFLGGCDFRCPFCHNFELADGSAQPVMEEDELFSFLEKRTGLLDGVAITGGEPCLHRDLPDLLRKIRSLGFMTKLDTNGNHPEVLRQILEEGLADYVAMDIKNSPARYAETAGLAAFDLTKVKESVNMIMEAGTAGPSGHGKANPAGKEKNSLLSYEFRTTVVKEFHRAEDFEEIGQWIAGAQAYFLQSFTDRDTVPYGNLHAPSKEELEEFRRIAAAYVPDTQIRGV